MQTIYVLICIIAATLSLGAQEHTTPLYLGGFAGYGVNTHMSNFKALPAIPCCSPGFDEGSGSGLSAGLLAGYQLTHSSSVQLRVGYASLHGSLVRDELIGNTLVLRTGAPFDTTTADIITQHSIDATLHTVFLEPAFVWSPLPRLGVHIGVSGAWLFVAEFRQKEELQSPSTVVFTGSDSRIRNEASGDLPGAASVLLHAVAGVSYDFPISAHATLAPEIRWRAPLNSIADVDWQVGALTVGVALKVDMAEPELMQIRRDTVFQRDTVQQVVAGINTEHIHLVDTKEHIEEERMASLVVQTLTRSEQYRRDVPAPSPHARLAIVGVASTGERTDAPVIIIEETQAQESFPLLPYVFFQRDAADVADSYQHQIQAVGEFDTTHLHFSALAVYDDMLNILAERMMRFPESRIVITGCKSDDESDNTLPQRRAKDVQRYLTSVGGIEAKRIAIQARGLPASPSNTSTADGRDENRRAEITASDPRLLAPIVLRTVERVLTPPELECLPEILSAEPAAWRVTVRAEASGTLLVDTAAAGTPPPIRLKPDGTRLMHDTAVVGVLTVTQNNSSSVIAESRLPLRQLTIARRRNDSTNIEIERFALVLFDYNSTGIDAANEQILEHVRSRIQPQSRVRIIGYTDRTGEGEYNQKLADRRCREVRRLLGFADAETEAIGSSRLLFDNGTPHGRMYSRTVHIVIETPVKRLDGQ